MQLVQRHSTLCLCSIQQEHMPLRMQIVLQHSTEQMQARQLRHRLLLLLRTGTQSNKRGLWGLLLCT